VATTQPATALFLLECGCDLLARNADHYTALHFAARHGLVEISKHCVEAGIGVNMRTRAGLTALHLACQGSHVHMCFWLLHRPAIDINARDNRGMTALHHAASGVSEELVELLLSYGANAHLANYVARGYLPVEVAKDDAIIQVLNKCMAKPETQKRKEHERKLQSIVVSSCQELCDHRAPRT
jgi:ankyrin repeat protein